MEYAISIKNLKKNYGDFTAVNGISFDIPKGKIFGLLGPNGSGKSTLSRLLGKMENPSSGVVKYGDGVNMAFYSQESSQNLNYEKTILEEINAVPTDASDQEKRNLLGTFLFSGDDIFKPVSVLSGGQDDTPVERVGLRALPGAAPVPYGGRGTRTPRGFARLLVRIPGGVNRGVETVPVDRSRSALGGRLPQLSGPPGHLLGIPAGAGRDATG